MVEVKQLHDWNVTYQEAVSIQSELCREVRFAPLAKRTRTVAGADVSYDKRNNTLYAAISVFRYPDMAPIEEVSVKAKATFPYIPGLLSFREAPGIAKAFQKLNLKPDILICDGQGVAHPRGFGLASHLGLLFEIPSIGCAKSRLCGTHGPIGPDIGNYASLKLDGKTIGAVVRTRKGVKPVFVSVGHMITLGAARRVVLRCTKGYRLPEPTRRAHRLVTSALRRDTLQGRRKNR